MTADDRDPLPAPDWHPTSSAWARRAALEATEAAVKAAKDRRNAPYAEDAVVTDARRQGQEAGR